MTPVDKKAAQLSRRIDEIYSHLPAEQTTDQGIAVAEQEFKALADVYLGPQYPSEKILAVARLQGDLQKGQKELTDRLEEGLISYADCANQLRALLTDIAFRCEEILGSEDFVKLFGVPAKDAAGLLDLHN